jgi:hypothetical protein
MRQLLHQCGWKEKLSMHLARAVPRAGERDGRAPCFDIVVCEIFRAHCLPSAQELKM